VQIGDVHTGAAKLRLSSESLETTWSEAHEQWRDSASRSFEETYLEVLRPQIKSTLEAMNRLANVLTQARHECDPQ
jgi:hypothetical protein